ncbi:MAG: alcohol dehydrogenase catalytic domain-containing protein [Thermoplasmata archaeon]
MKAVRVPGPGGTLELVDVAQPSPTARQVLIHVDACGICHSDAVTVSGGRPGMQYPRIPGHEVVGTVVEVGAEVPRWKTGERVGIGWHGWHDGTCPTCRRGDPFACPQQQITGLSFDGGYAQYMVAPYEGLAAVPTELSAVDAAPLLCAGVTTFNALRNCGARPGDLVAVLGLGGLGHLAVQYAAKMGFRTVVVARGPEKSSFARQLGATAYVDSLAQNAAEELTGLGGAQVILSTVTDAQAIGDLIGGLSVHGTLISVGVPRDPVPVSIGSLLAGRRSVQGWYSGVAVDSEDALRFSVQTGVRPMSEVFPLENAPAAFERMLRGTVRFRAVLQP